MLERKTAKGKFVDPQKEANIKQHPTMLGWEIGLFEIGYHDAYTKGCLLLFFFSPEVNQPNACLRDSVEPQITILHRSDKPKDSGVSGMKGLNGSSHHQKNACMKWIQYWQYVVTVLHQFLYVRKKTNGTKTQPQCSVNFLKHQGVPTLKPFAAPGVQCSWRFAALYQLRRYSYTWGVISLEKWAFLICCALKQKNIKDFYISVEVYGMLMSDMLCLYIVYIYKYIHIFSCLQYVGSFQDQMQEPRPNSSFILWTTQLKDHLFQSSNVLKYPAMRGGKDETLS